MRKLLLIMAIALAACAQGAEKVSVPESLAPAGPATTISGPSASSPTSSTLPDSPAVASLLGIEFVVEYSGVGTPVFVDAPVGDDRVFIVSKDGRILIGNGGNLLPVPFLDVSHLVQDSGEKGLLGMAFDPGYDSNGRFYIHYSDLSGDTVVASYEVSQDRNQADPESGRIEFQVDQPAGNHNGGMLAFGPDGALYLGLGDGGRSDDYFGNGQRPDTLLGTLLRFEAADSGLRPAPDNPFIEGGGAPEVWAYGLRNPWRFSFDGSLLYVADVGQNLYEEVNVVQADLPGVNYGWSAVEALHCFKPRRGCDPTGMMLPVVEVEHGDQGACSITGGYVYRGQLIPELTGRYFYGDYCGGWVRSFVWDGTQASDIQVHTNGPLGQITSFGTDAYGEIYVTVASGDVLRMSPFR